MSRDYYGPDPAGTGSILSVEDDVWVLATNRHRRQALAQGAGGVPGPLHQRAPTRLRHRHGRRGLTRLAQRRGQSGMRESSGKMHCRSR